MNRIVRVVLVVMLALALALLVAKGCRWWAPHQLELSGTLELTEHALGARVPGRVITLTVDEGDQVKAGAVVATLDRFEQASRDYARAQALYDQGGVTAQAREQAALAVDDQRVVAPIDGVVLLKVYDVGEVVAPGAPIIVLGDLRRQWVRVFVPEGLIAQVRMGQPAMLRVDGMRAPVRGHVSFLATKAEFTPRNVQTPEERVTQTFAVKVEVDAPSAALHPGIAATVTLPLDRTR